MQSKRAAGISIFMQIYLKCNVLNKAQCLHWSEIYMFKSCQRIGGLCLAFVKSSPHWWSLHPWHRNHYLFLLCREPWVSRETEKHLCAADLCLCVSSFCTAKWLSQSRTKISTKSSAQRLTSFILLWSAGVLILQLWLWVHMVLWLFTWRRDSTSDVCVNVLNPIYRLTIFNTMEVVMYNMLHLLQSTTAAKLKAHLRGGLHH